MNKILSDYQPQTEALRNFSIDVSKEAVEKYALENLEGYRKVLLKEILQGTVK